EESSRNGLLGAPLVFVSTADGEIIQWSYFDTGWDDFDWPAILSPILATDGPLVTEIKVDGDPAPFIAAAAPITGTTAPYRSVLLVTREEGFQSSIVSGEGRGLRPSLFGTVIVAGWFVFYLLMRNLTRPVRAAAETAKQIVRGEYDVHLSTDLRERELHELM